MVGRWPMAVYVRCEIDALRCPTMCEGMERGRQSGSCSPLSAAGHRRRVMESWVLNPQNAFALGAVMGLLGGYWLGQMK